MKYGNIRSFINKRKDANIPHVYFLDVREKTILFTAFFLCMNSAHYVAIRTMWAVYNVPSPYHARAHVALVDS